MVSPSKTKFSRVAANPQQKTANPNKVKLAKGPKPLIYHCFYLDIQKYQLARKIEFTIKELGGKIEFFLNKEITHFITDKEDQQHQQQQQQQPAQLADFDGGPSSHHHLHQQSPATPVTPLTPKTPHSHPYHPHHLQYVNEASPSSPCFSTTQASASGTAAPAASTTPAKPTTGSENKARPVQPRSRADAMLQRVRQQNQNNKPSASNYLPASARSGSASPCSPAPVTATSQSVTTSTLRLDRNSQSPAQLAKSWGKPIWSTEYAIKFLKKVIENCKAEDDLHVLSRSSTNARKGPHPQHLRGDFVKIESFTRHHRPAFQLFKKWPVLNLNSKSATRSPFDSERDKSVAAPVESTIPAASNKTATAAVADSVKTTTATTNATTKQQTQQQQQCGYCEICRIEYDVLANHLNTDEHRAFVNDDKNFVLLDRLICDGGVNLEKFLSDNQKLVEAVENTEQNAKDENSEKEIVVREECKPEENPAVISDNNPEKPKEEEPVKVLRTYSRKARGKTPARTSPDRESIGSPNTSPPAKRTYAGRKSAQHKAKETTTALSEAPADSEAASSSSITAVDSQMFGRRSAIYHHPHNTLNHHNHQKAKTAKLVQQAILNSARSASELVTIAQGKESSVLATVAADRKESAVAADEMKVLNDSSSNEKEKERQSKRSAADRMGLKGSTIKPVHPAELMECDGLDPKNTKRISLGLRQNPKRANLNEDFTSLLDETLGPMRKPRIRRESAKRVNYSEPREDEIVSQEEIMQSILESTAKEANESRRKKPVSPKRPTDVKIRGIQWRAPSPQSRPPVKSPLLYKVIEQPKTKNKKTASPTKDPNTTGSPSKSNKNGLIVKIRRVRQSELSLLNDEAENFMFPKRDESTDEETDEDRQTTSETGPGDFSQEILSSDYDHRNSSMRRSAGTPAPTVRKRTPGPGKLPMESPSKKLAKDSDQESVSTPVGRGSRRGHRGVAALLHDNAEYYKFPDPGSRLRFPEAPIQPNPEVEDDVAMTPITPEHQPRKRGKKALRADTPAPATMTSGSAESRQQQDILLATRSSPSSPYHHQEQLSNCGKNIIKYVKGKEDGMGVFTWSRFSTNCKQIEPYRFAFERVPSLEPWYETFQRQDECSEKMYEYFGNTAYRKLPYEMGPLPPLKQNCCILNYRLKSKTPEKVVPTSGSSCGSGSSSSSTNSVTTSINASFGATTTSTTSTATTSAARAAGKTDDDDKQPLSLPLKKRKLLLDSERPRKSPREHASTLAILSLLHQQTQHNRRRTFSGGCSVPYVTTILPPPSPLYSPKKTSNQQQQEADSALGDEIRSSCGSDPVTEREDSFGERPSAKKIKFDPPVLEDSFVNYKVLCQELETFLNDEEDELLCGMQSPPVTKTVPIGATSKRAPIKRDLLDIVRACDKEPPLTLKAVKRHESIVRKIVQYDRKPRPLSAITVKSFDGGGGLGLFRKRINRTGWPNVKKRIVTRKQQLLLKVKKEEESDEVKKEGEETVEGDGSRKSSTEESQVSATSTGDDTVKPEEDDDEDEDDEDEFEDTMTMLDDEEPNEKTEQLMTEDEEDPHTPMKSADLRRTPVPSKTEEVIMPHRTNRVPLPSSKYVTKTTTTMTRVDYNVPTASSLNLNSNHVAAPSEEQPSVNHTQPPVRGKSVATNSTVVPCTSVLLAGSVHHEDDDKECDSISSRSIFVSDDCDTTSSTLINMCTDEPLITPASCGPGSHRNSATPQPIVPTDEPPDRPGSRSRLNNSRHLNFGPRRQTNAAAGNGKTPTLQPVICIEKLNCSSMRTRSSSRTPVKTYKRSVFTSALVNSSGKPLKRKKKKKHKLNGNSSSASAGTSSPSCSDELNSVSSSLECDDPSNDTNLIEDSPPRKSTKNRPPTPSPLKFSPRKLRKPRGRWYRER